MEFSEKILLKWLEQHPTIFTLVGFIFLALYCWKLSQEIRKKQAATIRKVLIKEEKCEGNVCKSTTTTIVEKIY